MFADALVVWKGARPSPERSGFLVPFPHLPSGGQTAAIAAAMLSVAPAFHRGCGDGYRFAKADGKSSLYESKKPLQRNHFSHRRRSSPAARSEIVQRNA
ncbi:hypothetical protein LOC51_01390 [Rubrivivax sp. JA1024]|nr:hypothetical protein [Rubrivivax sp. JA1024]